MYKIPSTLLRERRTPYWWKLPLLYHDAVVLVKTHTRRFIMCPNAQVCPNISLVTIEIGYSRTRAWRSKEYRM